MAKAPTDIRSLARGHTRKALSVLAAVMSADDAPHSARVAAAIALLDRGWGKPMQQIEHSGEIASSVVRAPHVAPSTEEWQRDNAPQTLQ